MGYPTFFKSRNFSKKTLFGSRDRFGFRERHGRLLEEFALEPTYAVRYQNEGVGVTVKIANRFRDGFKRRLPIGDHGTLVNGIGH